MRHPRTLAVAALAIGSLALAACSASNAPSSDETEPAANGTGTNGEALAIQTSFYPLTFLAERIGGELATVTSLTPAGAEPHDLELSPAQVSDLTDADLLIYLSGFQPAIDDAVAVAAPNALDLAPAVDLLDGQGEQHAHEAGDEHDHGDLDPHFWLDPQRMVDAGDAVAAAFTQADPTHAETYAVNLEALRADLTELDAAYSTGLAQCQSTTLVTSHDAFGYLAARYGLEQVGIAGLDPEAEASPARLREITEVIEQTGATTIFTETLIDSGAADVLASDLDITTSLLDPVEAITDQSPGADYLEVMNANLDSLRSGLGCA